jgi:hypothetical protein
VLQCSSTVKEKVPKVLKNEPVKFQDLKNEFWNHGFFLFCDITAHLIDHIIPRARKMLDCISNVCSSGSFQNAI